MINKRNFLSAFVAGVVLVGSIVLGADAQQSGPADPSTASRQKMAEVHQRMATCLRSDRPIAECRSDMLKNCQDLMDKEGCPMMGPWGGGMGPGMMGGRMMQDAPVNQGPPK
ncbi:MAG TPA: hypothetical protein VKM54_23400 [Myxococcota bacterium]|nr:hypothetical protein [Myxococcota bacterium]